MPPLFVSLGRALTPMIVVFLVNLPITYTWYLYDRWPSLDVPMHAIGGFAAAWSVWNVVQLVKQRWSVRIEPPMIFYAFIVTATIAIGVVWEGYEFLHDRLFSYQSQAGVPDTMMDFLMNTLGAVLFCSIHSLRNRRKSVTKK